MRYATLTKQAGGGLLEVTVTKLPRQAEALLANVNRWRGQMNLGSIDQASLATLVKPLEAGALPAVLVKLETEADSADTTAQERMLAAIIHTADSTWFFKVRSGSARIAEAESDFLTIIRSVRSTQAPPDNPSIPTGPATTLVEGEDGRYRIGPLTYRVPDGWVLDPQPRTARLGTLTFSENGAEGEMTITRFPGDVGGELANVNRWRGQLGLPPVPDLSGEDVKPATINGRDAKAYRFSSPDTAPVKLGILVASHQHQGFTWFFKMTGPSTLLRSQTDRFNEFLASVTYSQP